MTRTNYKLKNT